MSQPPPPAADYKAPGGAPPPYPTAAPAQPGYPQQTAYPSPQQYPQAQGYGGPPAQPMGTAATTVVVTQPGTVLVNNRLGPNPANTTCPYCQAHITTTTTRSCGGFVWMVAGIICLIGCFFPLLWLGCCLIPFCIPSLYDTTHTCPNCSRTLYTHTHFN